MSSDGYLDPETDNFESRPTFYIGQHDSDRAETLTDTQHNYVLSCGVSPAPQQTHTIGHQLWTVH
jgi:type II protein arginine methyltransferase